MEEEHISYESKTPQEEGYYFYHDKKQSVFRHAKQTAASDRAPPLSRSNTFRLTERWRAK
jgi:hypothetical protein